MRVKTQHWRNERHLRPICVPAGKTSRVWNNCREVLDPASQGPSNRTSLDHAVVPRTMPIPSNLGSDCGAQVHYHRQPGQRLTRPKRSSHGTPQVHRAAVRCWSDLQTFSTKPTTGLHGREPKPRHPGKPHQRWQLGRPGSEHYLIGGTCRASRRRGEPNANVPICPGELGTIRVVHRVYGNSWGEKGK